MTTINVIPKGMSNGDSVLYYKDTVDTTGRMFSFPSSQARVVVKNLGTDNLAYSIGSKTGSLGPSETIDVIESISQFTLTASSKTQAFEVWSDVLGNNQSGVDLSSITSQLADKVSQSKIFQTELNPKIYGAIADGLSHKISDVLPSVALADVQALDPNATLNDEVDWYAIQKCISVLSAHGGTVKLEGSTYVISRMIDLTGYDPQDGWDKGGITLKGTSMRGTILKATFVGSLIKREASMCNGINNLSLSGLGKTNVGSIGIQLQGTGGSMDFSNVYIHDFEKGITGYDVTLLAGVNINIRNCSHGVEGQWNCDIFSFIGSRFDYCDNAIYIGGTSTTHPSGSQEENAWKFVGCRISNNQEGVTIADNGASNIIFDSCYFEGNIKEGTLGSSTIVQPDSTCILFIGCYWTPYNTNTQGYIVPGQSIAKFQHCKIAGNTSAPYNPFVKISHVNGALLVEGLNTSGVTNLANYNGRTYNYNPVDGSRFSLNSKDYGKYALDNNPTMEPPIDYTITGGTNKKFWSVKKASSADESTLAEVFIKDVSGQVQLGGTSVINTLLLQSGATTSRPALISTQLGYQYFDTTIGKPIWWNGSAWKDSTGTTV